uniref:Uncharacterized protein n=1 Tax=Opuntia streptacantha TaxID=393608 RepID=A0A7C8YL35_OPUST
MKPKRRKKEPPDPSPPMFGSLFGGCPLFSLTMPLLYAADFCPSFSFSDLNLCLCRVCLLSSALLILQDPDLGLQLLKETQSPVSGGRCDWPNLRLKVKLSALATIPNALIPPVSLYLKVSAGTWLALYPNLCGRFSVWRIMGLFTHILGTVELVFGKPILLLVLPVRLVNYGSVSPGLHFSSGLVCTLGLIEEVYASIAHFDPMLVRSGISTSPGAFILADAPRFEPAAGRLRRLDPRSALGVSWYVRSFSFNFFTLLIIQPTQVRSHRLPLLTFFMGNYRNFFSVVVWCYFSECCEFWLGLHRLYWLWNSLWLFCPSGFELMEIAVSWFVCLLFENGLLCHWLLRIWLILWLQFLKFWGICCPAHLKLEDVT